jgi:drug/metabolite transporter (DMT)-like permease
MKAASPRPPGPSTVVATLAAFGAVLCWGSGPVMSKSALSSSGPLFLLAVQLGASIIFLLAAALFTGKRITLERGYAALGLTGVFEPTLGYGLGNIGLTATTASVATLIAASETPFVCILMYILYRVRPNAFTAVAVMGVGIGVFLVVHPSLSGGAQTNAVVGNMFVLAGALAAAFYVTLSSKLVRFTDPLPLLIAQQVTGFIVALVWLAIAVFIGWEDIPRWSGVEHICFAAVSGVVEFGPPFWLFLIAMRGLSANAVAVITALVPVVAVFEARLSLGEGMLTTQWIGSGLIIGATIIAKRA